jgi:hypothetical protein
MDETPNTPHQVETEPLKNIGDKERADIKEWIKNVSEIRPELGGFSICPFSKKANYEILKIDIDKIYPINDFDVLIYIVEETDLEAINWWVDFYNKKYNNWIFFEDCASYDTFINGVRTGKGRKIYEYLKSKEKTPIYDKYQLIYQF